MKKNSSKETTKGVIVNMIAPIRHEFHTKDFLQVLVGASILAVPVGYTEETWLLGEVLPFYPNILGFLILSLLFIGAFTYYHYYKHGIGEHRKEFLTRVILTYLVAFSIVAIVLALVGKTHWDVDWILTIKRIIIVAFPCSLSGAIADTIK